jgi:hypothetical protein
VARGVRTWRRLRWPAVVILFLTVYVGSYAHLSRRGMAEAARVGSPYFFYCPVSDLVPYQDLPRQHCLAGQVFDPLNQLDRAWFGGGTPCRRVSWGLSGPTREGSRRRTTR